MNTITTVLVSSLLLTATAAADTAAPAPAAPVPAPAPAKAGKMIGVDAGVAMPTGDLSDAVGIGIGALVRLEMPLNPKLTLTARAGYIHHLSKDSSDGFGGSGKSSAAQVPFFGGVRYALSQSTSSTIYGAAEAGFDMFRTSLEVGGQSMSGSDTNLGLSLGAGYRAGSLDLRGGLLFADFGHLGESMSLMATAGFDVAAL